MVFSNPIHQLTFQKQVLKTSTYTCKCGLSKEKHSYYGISCPKWGPRLRECRRQVGISVQDPLIQSIPWCCNHFAKKLLFWGKKELSCLVLTFWPMFTVLKSRGGRRGGSGWRTHVHPWLIHVKVWQNSLQYSKVISLQLK